AEADVQLLARLLSDALEPRTLGADHDGLLAGAVHADAGAYHQLRIHLFELLDLDRDAVRQLLDQLHGELLADGLGDRELDAAVGSLVLPKELRRPGQPRA